MPLILTDEQLKEAKLTEQEARIELACRLYDSDRLSKPAASRLAGLSRAEFEDELLKRGLPWIRITSDEYIQQEMKTLEATEQLRQKESQC